MTFLVIKKLKSMLFLDTIHILIMAILNIIELSLTVILDTIDLSLMAIFVSIHPTICDIQWYYGKIIHENLDVTINDLTYGIYDAPTPIIICLKREP